MTGNAFEQQQGCGVANKTLALIINYHIMLLAPGEAY
jgi:hypothetical protein